MADTIAVRVTDGDVWVDGEHLTRGDEVEIPIDIYERIPRSFERLGEVVQSAADGDELAELVEDGEDVTVEEGALTVDDLDPHPDDLTVDELEHRVENVTDVELLQTILEAEQADGSPRSTAVDAIERRLADLSEE